MLGKEVLGQRGGLARMQTLKKSLFTIGSGSGQALHIARLGQQPGRASGPSSTLQTHCMAAFRDYTMSVVHYSEIAMLLPYGMPGKVDARLTVGARELEPLMTTVQ